jgi:hypothetical protein
MKFFHRLFPRRPARRKSAPRLTVEVLESRDVPSSGFTLGPLVQASGPSPFTSSIFFRDPPAVPTNGQSATGTPLGTPTSLPFTGHGSGGFTNASGGFFATGIATHLGAFTHYGTLVLTPTTDPFVFAVSGRTVYQAANGDLLYAVTAGTLNVLTGVATGTDTWDGGTGRFTDASGVVDLSAQLFPDGSLTFSLLGNIAY